MANDLLEAAELARTMWNGCVNYSETKECTGCGLCGLDGDLVSLFSCRTCCPVLVCQKIIHITTPEKCYGCHELNACVQLKAHEHCIDFIKPITI